MMKFAYLLVLALLAAIILPEHQSSAFSPIAMTTSHAAATSVSDSPSALSMGFFDMFSKEAQEERERKKRAIVEEQERLQKEIMERRRNPEKMEEYEIKTQMRRELRMKGKDDEALNVAKTLYADADNQTLLNGSKGAEE
mmetsp:Transcript_16913/g.39062  ORF Transcript_16913/g.39062 Transcript_16913/m.39062 type:complete len:140 (+) Transcript_16913:89-508(+)